MRCFDLSGCAEWHTYLIAFHEGREGLQRRTGRQPLGFGAVCEGVKSTYQPDLPNAAFHIETNRDRRADAVGIHPQAVAILETLD